ncbi:MAG: hypothetical protein C5B49_10355 [Bdellovibrio sp.]|nr:MAG: hypothetical protein C5B49_10355 [Bdellovibrio sp.]
MSAVRFRPWPPNVLSRFPKFFGRFFVIHADWQSVGGLSGYWVHDLWGKTTSLNSLDVIENDSNCA